MTSKLTRRFKNAAEKALNHLRDHRWHMAVEKSEMEGVNYYVCKKTGDRKADTNTLREADTVRPFDEAWLQGGSGQYYIDGQTHGQRTNSEKAIEEVRRAIAQEKARRRAEASLLLGRDDNDTDKKKPAADTGKPYPPRSSVKKKRHYAPVQLN